MGAWGYGSFENDDALDWIAELEEAEDIQLLEHTLAAAADEPDYLEVDRASKAVAAAEVVAALAGLPTAHLPEEAIDWVRAHQTMAHKDLIALALRSLDRVKRVSELAELWAEGDAREWLRVLDELRSRLSQAHVS
jgi:MoxR-like ATPase